jgi:hypothetical protein
MAAFNLVDVMADSSPLVVESHELNLFLITLLAGVLLLAFMTFAFLGGRKKK